MSTQYPHVATGLFLSCIDDRLIQSDFKFFAQAVGEPFVVRLAGGAGALLNPDDRKTALKQIAAAYKIAGITEVYLQSHTDCGAYRLAGVTFDSPEAELKRLYADLDEAAGHVRSTLTEAGADPAAIAIHTRVVNPVGQMQERA
jgi:carbonic anhydrase